MMAFVRDQSPLSGFRAALLLLGGLACLDLQAVELPKCSAEQGIAQDTCHDVRVPSESGAISQTGRLCISQYAPFLRSRLKGGGWSGKRWLNLCRFQVTLTTEDAAGKRKTRFSQSYEKNGNVLTKKRRSFASNSVRPPATLTFHPGVEQAGTIDATDANGSSAKWASSRATTGRYDATHNRLFGDDGKAIKTSSQLTSEANKPCVDCGTTIAQKTSQADPASNPKIRTLSEILASKTVDKCARVADGAENGLGAPAPDPDCVQAQGGAKNEPEPAPAPVVVPAIPVTAGKFGIADFEYTSDVASDPNQPGRLLAIARLKSESKDGKFPSFLLESTDSGKTWSIRKKFDDKFIPLHLAIGKSGMICLGSSPTGAQCARPGEDFAAIDVGGGIVDLKFSPDGRTLIVASKEYEKTPKGLATKNGGALSIIRFKVGTDGLGAKEILPPLPAMAWTDEDGKQVTTPASLVQVNVVGDQLLLGNGTNVYRWNGKDWSLPHPRTRRNTPDGFLDYSCIKAKRRTPADLPVEGQDTAPSAEYGCPPGTVKEPFGSTVYGIAKLGDGTVLATSCNSLYMQDPKDPDRWRVFDKLNGGQFNFHSGTLVADTPDRWIKNARAVRAYDIQVLPTPGGCGVVIPSDGGLYLSKDCGRNWKLLELPKPPCPEGSGPCRPQPESRDIAVSTAPSGDIVIVTTNGGGLAAGGAAAARFVLDGKTLAQKAEVSDSSPNIAKPVATPAETTPAPTAPTGPKKFTHPRIKPANPSTTPNSEIVAQPMVTPPTATPSPSKFSYPKVNRTAPQTILQPAITPDSSGGVGPNEDLLARRFFALTNERRAKRGIGLLEPAKDLDVLAKEQCEYVASKMDKGGIPLRTDPVPGDATGFNAHRDASKPVGKKPVDRAYCTAEYNCHGAGENLAFPDASEKNPAEEAIRLLMTSSGHRWSILGRKDKVTLDKNLTLEQIDRYDLGPPQAVELGSDDDRSSNQLGVAACKRKGGWVFTQFFARRTPK